MPPGSAGTPGLEADRVGQPRRVDHQQHQVAPARVEPLRRQVHLVGRGEVHETDVVQRRRPHALRRRARPARRPARRGGGGRREPSCDPACMATTTGAGSRGSSAASSRPRPAAAFPAVRRARGRRRRRRRRPRLPAATCPRAEQQPMLLFGAVAVPRTASPAGPDELRARDPGRRRPDPRDDARPRSPRPTSRPGAPRWSRRSATSTGRSAWSRSVRRPACASIPTATATSSTAGRSARAAPST